MTTRDYIEQALLSYRDIHGPSASLDGFRLFLDRYEELTSRTNLAGHVTGSAIVWHRPTDQILRVHHTKLDRWVFSAGGHIDESEMPWQAAIRELHEETGIRANALFGKGLPMPFILDVQAIPASIRKSEPAHWHYDMIYLFEVEDIPEVNADPMEIKQFKWTSTTDVTITNAPVAFGQHLEAAAPALLAAKPLAR